MRVTTIHKAAIRSIVKRPFCISKIPAGFPSPADDYIERPLDLNELIIKRPAATYFLRAAGDSMTGAGIFSGDILVVDRSITPTSGRIVIAVINGEMTVKRLVREGGRVFLRPENERYPGIEITAEMNFEVWGVVSYVVHQAQ